MKIKTIFLPRFLSLASLVIAATCFSGCQREPEIRRYEVPKIVSPDRPASASANMPGMPAGRGMPPAAGTPHGSASPNQRMLAAIVPYGEQAWFFKILAPAADLEEYADDFRLLIKSLRFEDNQPQWDLPAGWQTRPGGGMRHATLVPDGEDGRLELSVIPLQISGPLDEYILSNVNRWRSQVGLPPIAMDALPGKSEQIELDGAKAVLVDLYSPQNTTSGAAAAETTHAPKSTPAFQYTVPGGWKESEKIVSRSGITLRHEAAFAVGDGEQTAEVTVDRLPITGSLKDNIDRWRGQVGLPALSDEEFQNIPEIRIGGLAGQYVEAAGSEQTILGAIVAQGDTTWYFKIKGPQDIVKQQQSAFRDFLKSIQF